MEDTTGNVQTQATTLAFDKKVHSVGRITVLLSLLSFVALPIILSLTAGAPIDWAVVAAGALAIVPTFTLAGLAENLAYCPVIGPGALYISCITGNVSNMKVPACINAMDVGECTPGSEKGDVLSIVAVCTSTFVTTAIVLLGMLFLAPLFAPVYNNPVMQPAFSNLMPALFGALLFPYLLRFKKESIVPVLLPVAIILIIGRSTFSSFQSYIMLGVIVASCAYSWYLHKKDFA